jgi:pyridinium-3,5-biscarboxylic acid mononucleotide sulfurtransferase
MTSASPSEIATIIRRVKYRIRRYGAANALVAFSGGVDSSVVLALSAASLTPCRVTAVTAVSPSYPSGELELAQKLARHLQVRHVAIQTHEVEKEPYARNGIARCFHCKIELYTVFQGFAASSLARDCVILSGANADDTKDFRPGLLAGRRKRVRSPLLEEGIGKDDIRKIANYLRLEVADKPALACLASRIAVGLRITPELLKQIDQAEQAVRALGFSDVRVRHFGTAALVQVPVAHVERLANHPELPELLERLQGSGWRQVGIDRQGLRSGSMKVGTPIPHTLGTSVSRVAQR